MSLEWNFDELWEFVAAHYHGGPHSIHGPSHWKRVMDNGLAIARFSGANETVVKLFALFHDSKRENEGYDPGHGLRGAEFAQLLLGERFIVTEKEFDLLFAACQWHTDQVHHSDETIGTCFDADRLDLGRVHINPDPKYLNTKAGIVAARAGSVEILRDMSVEELAS